MSLNIKGLRLMGSTAVRGFGLLSAILLMALAPYLWAALEARSAFEQAKILVDAAAVRAQDNLHDTVGRFERATAGLRAQDVQGDATSLAGRLVRAEPQVTPASGLLVLNAKGFPVAGSFPGSIDARFPPWWLSVVPSLRAHGAVLLGPGPSPVNNTQVWVLARRIEDAQGGTAGVVATFLSEDAVRAMIGPSTSSAGMLSVRLVDANGQELLHSTPASDDSQGAFSWLFDFYRVFTPDAWVAPDLATAEVSIGGLRWVGQVTSASILKGRAEEVRQRGIVVIALVGAFGVVVLLGWRPLAKAHPESTQVPAVQADGWRARAETAESEVEKLRRNLTDITGGRDRVLAAIGHDVRTPINSILGISALLMDGDLDDTQRKWLQRIRASCEVLLAMLNGMLEIAAAQVDGAEIHLEPVNVAVLIEEVGEVFRPHAHDKGLELKVAVEDGVLGMWRTDPTRLRQVLFNLAGNAIKYTTHGSVEIRALTADRGGAKVLQLRVSDTGPGIAEYEKELIFEHFKRGREEVSRGRDGLGLGLALCRDIATLLEGSLSFESTLSVGSVFTFEIPIEPVEDLARSASPLRGRTALVVGLSEGVRRRVASYLEHLGFGVETAADGFIALGQAERTAFQHGTLDLVVVDAALIGLPADGFLARLQANRALESTRTVLVDNGRVPASIEGRADMMVPHPVETRDLERIVTNLFGKSSLLQELDPRAPPPHRPRVLVVEDNRINQALLMDLLERAGFSTYAASSGEDAVQAAARGGFDAILMDVQMTGIDGMEATRLIRAAEQGSRTAIIGHTAHSGTMIRRSCMDAGMDAVLHKPVDVSRLPLRLREAISAARQATVLGEADRLDLKAEADSALDIADEYLEALLLEVGVERTRTCVDDFLVDTEAHLPEMERLLRTSECPALGRLAHDLAGVAGTLGAISFGDSLLLLEDAAREADSRRLDLAFKEMLASWHRVKTSLRWRFEALASKRAAQEDSRAA
jgi:signal transduction histidine kinase/DNA-binding response OmpR family regulator